ncbi:MAG: sulfotransferase [Verrucomicrobiota bacterium]
MCNHLFIVTYGRTGSTLLLGILNSHPKIRIHGENEGLFYQLYSSLKALDAYERHRLPEGNDTSSEPFFGSSEFPYHQTRNEICDIFDHFFPEDDAVETRGFKEIRYDMPDLENYLDFLKGRYENTRFIFLTRDHQAVARSGFYQTTDPDFMESYLTILESRFLGYAGKNPESSFHLRYEELLDFARIQELFSFIGHPANEAIWRDAVAAKHSFNQKAIIGVSKASNLVIFDSAKRLLESSHLDIKNHELKNISKLALTGVLLPFPESGELTSLTFQGGSARYQAKLGIPSPGYRNKFPHNPLAATARFSFIPDPPDLRGGIEDFDLVATFANTGAEVIGRLFISVDHGRTP